MRVRPDPETSSRHFEPWMRYVSRISVPRFPRLYTGKPSYSYTTAWTSGMLRPSFHRRMPPTALACLGGALTPTMNIMPLTRWTSRSPATPVPYSFQQRHRAKILGSNARLGTVPCQVSQSRFLGERSGGGGYSHAPLGSLRPSQPSTSIRSPSVPWDISSFALAQICELTRCDPIWMMRPVRLPASTMATPSAGLCDIGFSQ